MSSHHLLANSSDSEDGDIESPSSVTAAFTTAPELFEQHPTDAIKTVQVKGMISCGKFEIEVIPKRFVTNKIKLVLLNLNAKCKYPVAGHLGASSLQG